MFCSPSYFQYCLEHYGDGGGGGIEWQIKKGKGIRSECIYAVEIKKGENAYIGHLSWEMRCFVPYVGQYYGIYDLGIKFLGVTAEPGAEWEGGRIKTVLPYPTRL